MKRNLEFQKDERTIYWHAKFQSGIASCCSLQNAEVAQFFIVLREGPRPFRRILNFLILEKEKRDGTVCFEIFEVLSTTVIT